MPITTDLLLFLGVLIASMFAGFAVGYWAFNRRPLPPNMD